MLVLLLCLLAAGLLAAGLLAAANLHARAQPAPALADFAPGALLEKFAGGIWRREGDLWSSSALSIELPERLLPPVPAGFGSRGAMCRAGHFGGCQRALADYICSRLSDAGAASRCPAFRYRPAALAVPLC